MESICPNMRRLRPKTFPSLKGPKPTFLSLLPTRTLIIRQCTKLKELPTLLPAKL